MIYGRYGLNKLAQELEQDKKEFLDFLHELQKREEEAGREELERRSDGITVAGLYQEILSGIRRLQAIAANRGI
jgi:hypothetical protein